MQAFSDEAGAKGRLMEGLAVAMKRTGYGATTIADVVRHARVSKRTFYEHFRDKEQCFLAAYDTAAERVLEAIAQAADAKLPWEEQIEVASRAYVSALESEPALTRLFLLEIHATGRAGLAKRRAVHQRFADLLRMLVDRTREEHPELRPLSAEMATAVVGGINEVLLSFVEGGKAHRLNDVARTAAELLKSVLR